MKKTGLLLAAIFLASFINIKAGNVSFNYFYSTLSPHGEWISLDYDLVVWRPNSVHYDWKPYSVGRWAWTNEGWYWDSYEPFGWAVYHYGRWHYDDYYGWVWVPDYEWAPSWVEWRYNDNYLGWAPLPPYAYFRTGIGISFSTNWNQHHRHWSFVSYDNFCHNNVNIYIVNNSNNYRIFNTTKYRTNYYADGGRIINRGIDKDYIENRSGRSIKRTDISRVSDYNSYEKNTKSRGGKITTFRPDDKEISRYREIEKYNVKSSDGKNSLQKDKIAIRSKDRGGLDKQGNNEPKVNREANTVRTPSTKIYDRREEPKTRTKKEYSTTRDKYSTETRTERKPIANTEVKRPVRSVEKQTPSNSRVESRKETKSSRSAPSKTNTKKKR